MEKAGTSERAAGLRRWGPWVVRGIGLWILAGALFKWLRGSPKDLPRVILDLPLELGLTYKAVISIELCVATLALLRPRWGWLLVVCLLVAFDAVLITLVAAGDSNCGCFGEGFPIPPWGMLAIDSSLLLALLATRPWSGPRAGGAGPAWIGLAWVLALVAPWLYDRQLSDVPDAATEAGGTRAPVGKSWVELDVEGWVGKDLAETPLSRWIDVYRYPPDGLWVFYRMTCDHCAHHLAYLADTEQGGRFLTLVRLEEEHDTEANRAVHRLPEGDFVQSVSLPDSVDYILQTPAELVVEEWRVVSGEEGVDVDSGH